MFKTKVNQSLELAVDTTQLDWNLLEVKEGKLSVKAFVGVEGGGPSYKKFGLRLKKLGSSIYGGDDVEISGPDSKLLKFAKASLGVGNKAKNLKDAQKEIDEVGP